MIDSGKDIIYAPSRSTELLAFFSVLFTIFPTPSFNINLGFLLSCLLFELMSREGGREGRGGGMLCGCNSYKSGDLSSWGNPLQQSMQPWCSGLFV